MSLSLAVILNPALLETSEEFFEMQIAPGPTRQAKNHQPFVKALG